MSLLDSSNESIVVYLEEVAEDSDGNTVTQPSTEGIATRARIQPLGTPTESQEGGFHTVSRYGLRFPRNWPHALGAQSQIEWQGKRFSVEGDPVLFNGSARTRHVHYVLRRA